MKKYRVGRQSGKHILFLFSLLFLSIFVSCSSSDDSSFLVDRGNLLSSEERRRLVDYHRVLLKDFNLQFKLVVLSEQADDINEQAVKLFGDLGSETGSARGMLFLVDPIGGQVRIEVGYDLEPVFPDGFVSYLERRQMVPFFSSGSVGAGIEATTELLIARIQRGAAGKPFDPTRELGGLAFFSGGGGAKIKAPIGSQPPEKEKSVTSDTYAPGDTPEGTFEIYKYALQHRIKDPDLKIFTPKTRAFFAEWLVTDAQQANELRGLREHAVERVIISYNRAVIRFSWQERTQSPYFLEKTEAGWQLDFWTMNKVIQMNHRNMWRFKSFDHPYMFAFSDWRFDSNGFPLRDR